MGIQAMGGIGRITSKIPLKNRSNLVYQPIRIPRGIPTATPSPPPIRTTFRLAKACCQI